MDVLRTNSARPLLVAIFRTDSNSVAFYSASRNPHQVFVISRLVQWIGQATFPDRRLLRVGEGHILLIRTFSAICGHLERGILSANSSALPKSAVEAVLCRDRPCYVERSPENYGRCFRNEQGQPGQGKALEKSRR